MAINLNSKEWLRDNLKPIPPKPATEYKYTKASYNLASQAIADFETGKSEFWILARDDRYYKLSTASAICKYWAKGKLFVREKVSLVDALNGAGYDLQQCGIVPEAIAIYSVFTERMLIQFAKDVLKASGES